MLKKLSVLALAFTFTNVALAETCPDVSNIKVGQFNGWQALDVNSDTPASAQAIATFKKKVKNFDQAEWSEDFVGHGHCYYTGYLEVLLAKDTAKPKISDHWSDTGVVLRCKSSAVKDCEF